MRPREKPGPDGLDEIRKAHRLGRRTAASHNAAHDRLEKMVGGFGEALDRLHPASSLAAGRYRSGAEAKARYDPSGEISSDSSRNSLLDVAKLLLAMARRRAADAPRGRRDGGR